MTTIVTSVRRHGRFLPAIDGLRAVAALLVVAHHASQGYASWLNGWAGVPIFFVLSGYLITRLSRADELRGGFSFRAFWVRRLTRIVPLYVAAVVCFAALSVAGYRGGIPTLRRALPYYLTFNAEYAPPRGPMVVAWSLGIEEKFYVVWPLLAFVILARRWLRLPAAAAAAVACLSLSAAFNIAYLDAYGALLVGCALAFAEERYGWLEHGAKWVARPVAGCLAAAGLASGLLAASAVTANVVYLYLAPVVAVLVAHLVYGRGPIVTGLASRPMTWLGRRSYGLYLFHTFALAVTAHIFGTATPAARWLDGIGCVVGGVVMAEVGYRLVERPAIAWGRRVAARVDTRQRVTAQAAEVPA